jgi:hypothetical protein
MSELTRKRITEWYPQGGKVERFVVIGKDLAVEWWYRLDERAEFAGAGVEYHEFGCDDHEACGDCIWSPTGQCHVTGSSLHGEELWNEWGKHITEGLVFARLEEIYKGASHDD